MRSFKKNNLPAWIAICSYGTTLALYPAAANAASNMLEEVIVEAQKKSETVIETPIAIQALTGDQFQKYASFNLQDLARTTAGLSFDTGVSVDIRLRGTSTVANAPVSLRTNIYVDGALIEQPRSIFDAQYDIERFEVLKGPQGTLYGKSSPTGTINIRTKNPNLSAVDGYVAGSIGNLSTRNTQFGISLPIIDGVLGVRLAGVYDENKTGQKDVTTGAEAQNRNSGARITVLWEPSDAFSARASYNYREKSSNPWYTLNGAGYRYYDDKVTVNAPDVDKSRDQLAILELNYSIQDHLTLTSVTGYEDQEYSNFQDTDGTASPITSTNQLVGGDTQLTRIPLRPQWQQDLRLASEDNNFWDWQIGGYYHRSTSQVAVDVLKYSNGAATVNTTLIGINEEFAGYTHNTFKLTDQFNLIAGLRYQSFRQKTSQPTTGSVSVPGLPDPIDLVKSGLLNGEGIPADQQKTYAHPWTGTLKAQYFFDPDLVGYASIDRAYRIGAANLNLQGNLPADFATVKPESSNSVEVGLKGVFWDHRGRFTTAIFDQVYKGFQQDIQNITVYEPTPALGTTSIANSLAVNAKEAEIRGVEAEVSLLLVDGWDVTVSMTYNDAKFNDFKNNPCSGDITQLNHSNPYNTCDLSGERLPLAPKYSGVITSNFSMPAFDGTDWYFNTLLNARSDEIDKVTRSTLGGYATWDFFTGLRASDKAAWDVSLWVKNAFDRRVVTRVFNSTDYNPPLKALTGQTFDMVTTNLPRQIGMTGTYRF